MTGQPRLSIVIPVYNEIATIGELLRRVRAVDQDKEIVVVDDGSTDGTREFLTQLAAQSNSGGEARSTGQSPDAANLRILFQDRNRGKGAALRRGFQAARGEIVVIQDADLEYDPADYARLLSPILRGEADVVYGSRFLGGPHRVLLFWHYVGNRFLTALSDMVTNLNLSDVWTCYKAFKREVLVGLDLREDGFGFEQEVTIKIAAAGWRVYETPISYYGRTFAEGKKITWTSGVRALWCILRYGFRGTGAKAAASRMAGSPAPDGRAEAE